MKTPCLKRFSIALMAVPLPNPLAILMSGAAWRTFMRDPTLAAALERLVCDRCYVSCDASSTDRDTASASALADPS